MVSVSHAQLQLLRPFFSDAELSLLLLWPIARPSLISRQSRLERLELRLAFAVYMQQLQIINDVPLLPPCTWCGQPAGGCCDYCNHFDFSAAICFECVGANGDSAAVCKLCATTLNIPIHEISLRRAVLDRCCLYSDDASDVMLPAVAFAGARCQCPRGCAKVLRCLSPEDILQSLCWECRVADCVCQCIGCDAAA